MVDLKRSYWLKTHLLWGTVSAYLYLSWDVASWYTRASTSAFVWNLTRNYSAPFSVTQEGQEYECVPWEHIFITYVGLKHTYLSLMLPFLGITLICLLKDIFSVELLQFLQFCSKEVGRLLIINTKEKLANDQVVFVESEIHAQPETESCTAVEEQHAIVTTLLRIFSTVVAYYVIIYSLWPSFTEPEPSEGHLSEINLMDELVLMNAKGDAMLWSLLPIIPVLMVIMQLYVLAAVMKSVLSEEVTTSQDKGFFSRIHLVLTNFQRFRIVLEQRWRILILYSLHIVILVLTTIAFEASIGFGLYEIFQTPKELNERSRFTPFAVVCAPGNVLHIRWIFILLFIMCQTQFLWLYKILRIRTGLDINELSECVEKVEMELRAEKRRAQPPPNEMIPKKWRNPYNVVRRYDPLLNTFEFCV